MEKTESTAEKRKIRFMASKYSSGYSGNFSDIPSWMKRSFDFTVIYWKDVLMDTVMSPTELAEKIREYGNPLAQIESNFLKAVDTEEEIDEELLASYSELVEKRMLRHITMENMRENVDIQGPDQDQDEKITG